VRKSKTQASLPAQRRSGAPTHTKSFVKLARIDITRPGASTTTTAMATVHVCKGIATEKHGEWFE
jgi:hypothetical protein